MIVDGGADVIVFRSLVWHDLLHSDYLYEVLSVAVHKKPEADRKRSGRQVPVERDWVASEATLEEKYAAKKRRWAFRSRIHECRQPPYLSHAPERSLPWLEASEYTAVPSLRGWKF